MDIERSREVVISAADCHECMKFFTFFEVEMPDKLKAAFQNFINDQTYENQEELKICLAEVVITSNHPVFKDEVFAQVIPETKEVYDQLLFERELDKCLTSD